MRVIHGTRRSTGQLLFVISCSFIGLSACGGGGDSTNTSASSAATTPAANTPVTSSPPAPTVSSCTKLSPKVGQVANLITRSHGVTGTARIVDDCTIEITNFNYDGGGLPDVFVYGALARNYAAGFAIGPNLFGQVQNNTKLSLTLKDKEIDRLDSISIWCVQARVSFGDAVFAAP